MVNDILRRVGLLVVCVSALGGSEVRAEDKARVIEFGPYHWEVTASDALIYNHWSDERESVRVDDTGRLRLRLRQVEGVWYSSMIKSRRSFGYGDYRFQIATNTEGFDPNVNVGLFTYEDMKGKKPSEIDIELTRFGNTREDAPTMYYTVQPHATAGNIANTKMGLSGAYTTHRFVWKEDSITFQSYHGHANSIRDLPPKQRLIREWVYKGPDIPKPGDEKVYINLFLWNKGEPPTDGKDVELIIKNMIVMAAR